MARRLEDECYLKGTRWLLLIIVCSIIFANSLTFFTFGEINAACVEVFYDFNGAVTGEYLSMVYIMGNVVGAMIAMRYIHDVKKSVIIGNVLTILGVGLKFFSIIPSNDRYDPILWGQVLCGIGLPFSLSMIATISHNWFSSMERDWAMKYMYMAHPVGTCCGLLMGSYFGSHACSQMGFAKLFLAQETFLVVSLLAFSCFKPLPVQYKREELDELYVVQPNDFPSNSSRITFESNRRHKKKIKERENKSVESKLIRMQTNWLLKNPNIWTLAFCFASAYALIYSIFLATAEHSLAIDYGYSMQDTLIFIAAFAVGGLLGTYVYGACIAYGSHHPERGVYHPVRTAGFCLSLLSVIGFNVWLDGESSKDGMVAYFTLGVLMLPLIPVCLETGAELCFDVPEGIVSSLLFILGDIVLLASYVLIAQMDKDEAAFIHSFMKPPYKAVLLVLALSSCLFSFATRGPYKRSKAEHLKQGAQTIASPRGTGGEPFTPTRH
mmetsp:Transcript_33010/g.41520  ORF Transcript_33010/g.41520 Transcript_33010/m.41520 type:complete len:495 (+) Transcript_33010:112-1596(+)